MRFGCKSLFPDHGMKEELMTERHLCSMRMRLNTRKCARIKINMRTNWICYGMLIDR
jgi:hypothetical protein